MPKKDDLSKKYAKKLANSTKGEFGSDSFEKGLKKLKVKIDTMLENCNVKPDNEPNRTFYINSKLPKLLNDFIN